MILVDIRPDLKGEAKTFFGILTNIIFREKIPIDLLNKLRISLGQEFFCDMGIIENFDTELKFLYLRHGTDFMDNSNGIFIFKYGDSELVLPQTIVRKVSYVPRPNSPNSNILWSKKEETR